MDRQTPAYAYDQYRLYLAGHKAAPRQPQAFSTLESGLLDSSRVYILDGPASFDPMTTTQWDHPNVQRYLSDPHKTAFFNASLTARDNQSQNLGGMLAVARPVAASSKPLAALDSPLSSQDPSTISNTAFSPLAEAAVDFLPTSPGAEPWPSLFQPAADAEYFRLGLQAVTSAPAGPYVNPADVNSAQEPPPGRDYLNEHEDITLDLDILPNEFSWETYVRRDELEAADRLLGPPEYTCARMSSHEDDEPPIKDEIEARGLPSDYPSPQPLPQHESAVATDETSADESVPEMTTKRGRGGDGGDDDAEYKPRKRQSTTVRPSSNPRAARRKRLATSKGMERIAARRQPRMAANTATAATVMAAGPTPIMPLAPTASKASGGLVCRHCHQSDFKDEASLDYHIKKQHRRAFVCVFRFAGCDATFSSKNEWKRHVNSQHLVLNYWLCTEGECEKPAASTNRATSRKGGGSSARPPSASTLGNAFNRKDLYTQHLWRMHMPPHIQKALKQQKKPTDSKASTPEWDEIVARLQAKAVRERCPLPTRMACPVAGCAGEFQGAQAWDQRMEHVAKHLEQAAVDKEPPVQFGGPADPTLTQWAARPDVAVIKQHSSGGWVQNNTLRSRHHASPAKVAPSHDHDLDAEGEDDDAQHPRGAAFR